MILLNFLNVFLGDNVISLSFPIGSSALKMLSGDELLFMNSHFITGSFKNEATIKSDVPMRRWLCSSLHAVAKSDSRKIVETLYFFKACFTIARVPFIFWFGVPELNVFLPNCTSAILGSRP